MEAHLVVMVVSLEVALMGEGLAAEVVRSAINANRKDILPEIVQILGEEVAAMGEDLQDTEVGLVADLEEVEAIVLNVVRVGISLETVLIRQEVVVMVREALLEGPMVGVMVEVEGLATVVAIESWELV